MSYLLDHASFVYHHLSLCLFLYSDRPTISEKNPTAQLILFGSFSRPTQGQKSAMLKINRLWPYNYIARNIID